jgi:hypothetical protein
MDWNFTFLPLLGRQILPNITSTYKYFYLCILPKEVLPIKYNVQYTWYENSYLRPANHYQVDLTDKPDQVRLSGLPDNVCAHQVSGRSDRRT